LVIIVWASNFGYTNICEILPSIIFS